MNPRIETIKEKHLIGLRLSMSIAEDKTGELWQRFMPRKGEIAHRLNGDLISLQVYPMDYFADFKPSQSFEKWALAEVSEFSVIPEDMEHFIIPEGRYAVFHYKGSSLDKSIFQYIFGSWIPSSKFMIDERPHYEVLGEKYKNASPDSEEEIWIPVKEK